MFWKGVTKQISNNCINGPNRSQERNPFVQKLIHAFNFLDQYKTVCQIHGTSVDEKNICQMETVPNNYLATNTNPFRQRRSPVEL